MDTSPTPTIVTYFVRIDGALHQVCPLTKPNRENPNVTVESARDGSTFSVHNTDIIRSY